MGLAGFLEHYLESLKGASIYFWQGKLEKEDIGVIYGQSRRQQCDVMLIMSDEGRASEVCSEGMKARFVKTNGIVCKESGKRGPIMRLYPRTQLRESER